MIVNKGIATHEAGHVIASLTYSIPIISVSIDRSDGTPPHIRHGIYQMPADLAPEAYGVFCLAGGSAEQLFFGSITDGSDAVDVAACRENLFLNGFDVLTVGGEMARLRAAADRLVRTERQRIEKIAQLLLRYGSLSGDQIFELSR